MGRSIPNDSYTLEAKAFSKRQVADELIAIFPIYNWMKEGLIQLLQYLTDTTQIKITSYNVKPY